MVVYAEKKLRKRYGFREELIEFLKIGLVILPLQFLFKRKTEKKMQMMRKLPSGTVGKDVSLLLEKNNLKIIPVFENHDLKHIVLGYGMTSVEEIKMQAFLFGNGNYSPFCILFLSCGIFFPKEWFAIYQEYLKGKNSPSISKLNLNDSMLETTSSLIKKYGRN